MRRHWLVVGMLNSAICIAAEPPVDELEQAFGTSDALTLATGYTQPLFEAPSTATVLSEETLKALGAKTLRDALELVPGYLVSSSDGRDTITTVRGVTSRTLVLIDGVPVAGTLLQPFQSYDNLLLNNVQRLEIVRGPASSLYGADAVAGVINMITKTSTHDRREVTLAAGSFDSYEASYLDSFHIGELDASVFLGGRSTDFTDAVIAADSQSVLDTRFRTMASLAPGRLPAHRDQLEARVDATFKGWTARAHYSNVYNWQTGVIGALSRDATADALLYGATFLNKTAVSDDWVIDSVLDYSVAEQPAEGDLFPPGAFGGAFPDGVLTKFKLGNTRVRAETTALFSGWRGNTLRIGGGGLRNEFRLKYDLRNFVVRAGRILPAGAFGPGDPQLPNVNQDNYYLYIQDQWNVAKDLSLTAGVRGDQYSDFGSTINPRLGIVWNTGPNTTVKLLYGRAFRPPSVNESSSEGIFSAAGRRNLNPTTLTSTEVSVNYRTRRTSTTVTGFVLEQDDLIQIIPDPMAPRGTAYTNQGTETGSGAELESTIELPFGLRLHGGYAYQERHGASLRNNLNLRFDATHALNCDLIWEPTPDWTLGLRSISIFDRKRAGTDIRTPADDYTVVTGTLTRQRLAGVIDLGLSIHNLLNEDARDQSDSISTVPLDIPRAGRSVLVTAVARW